MNNKIFDEVKKLIPDVYLVGGSVRDILLGHEPKDYDFCTSLLPDVIESSIRNAKRHPFMTGKRFGTLGMKIDGTLVEITTFRTEKYQDGNRKPTVDFVNDLKEDLSRRDFTINAIAYDGEHFIDPFRGQSDLRYGVIKAVGNPVTRFKEDPLRMLRGIRFATVLAYQIELRTLNSITKKAYKILQISKERWMQELDKILLSMRPSIGLQYLAYTHLLHYIIPELSLQIDYNQNNPYHRLNLWEHTLKVVDSTPQDINLRWAALLHDIAKPFVRKERPGRSIYIKHDMLGADMVERLARHLKWSNERREAVVELVKNHMNDDSSLRQYDAQGH